MIVTDLKYHLENKLVKKLDVMCNRCTNKKQRKDALAIFEGSEGEGKTNASVAAAYYAKSITKFPIHMFFRLESMLEFAKQNEEKIIIWDEPSLDMLSSDWYKDISINLIRMLMTCRKKRHFFIFNFVKFYKFNEYIVVDRALGLVHLYSRYGIEAGRFAYIRQKNLQNLWTDYKSKKKREYKRYRAFGGKFPLVEHLWDKMDITIEGVPHCDLIKYEELKDKAIESLGKSKTKSNIYKIQLSQLKSKIGKMKLPIKTQIELAKALKVGVETVRRWRVTPLEGGDVPPSDEIDDTPTAIGVI